MTTTKLGKLYSYVKDKVQGDKAKHHPHDFEDTWERVETDYGDLWERKKPSSSHGPDGKNTGTKERG